MAQKTVILIGAGNRGEAYTNYAKDHPDQFKVVGVADPIAERREYMMRVHGIPAENCYDSWDGIFEREKFADLAMICTQDKDHKIPALKAIELGYDILLEKPMATTPEECYEIAEAANAKGVNVIVCFVLRFSTFYVALKKLVLEGKVGQIMNIDHVEAVGNVHYSHSYTRGNWKNSEESSCMILAKSSHDIDILQWLIDAKCTKVQSFGSLMHFTKENKPEGSPERCIDGCPYAEECYYNNIKWYLDKKDNAWFRCAATGAAENPSDEVVEHALRTTEYGKCVYNCSNNVVDHQTVNLLYDNGVTATFTMSAFNEGGRYTRIMGTKGEIYGSPDDTFITYYDFATREKVKIEYADMVSSQDLTGGHGGGDSGIMLDLYKFLQGGYDGFSITPINNSSDNHITTFAAEFSRVNGGMTVDVEEYKKSLKR